MVRSEATCGKLLLIVQWCYTVVATLALLVPSFAPVLRPLFNAHLHLQSVDCVLAPLDSLEVHLHVCIGGVSIRVVGDVRLGSCLYTTCMPLFVRSSHLPLSDMGYVPDPYSAVYYDAVVVD